MRVEGDGDGVSAQLVGALNTRGDDLLVSVVHTVEVTDGHDTGLVAGDIREGIPDVHKSLSQKTRTVRRRVSSRRSRPRGRCRPAEAQQSARFPPWCARGQRMGLHCASALGENAGACRGLGLAHEQGEHGAAASPRERDRRDRLSFRGWLPRRRRSARRASCTAPASSPTRVRRSAVRWAPRRELATSRAKERT